jgi:serine/threonine protein kinase
MDPTLPYDFQSLWCSKHRDGLHYLANWQLEELFAELDESLEDHASEEERRLLEGQKRMLLPALMQIEMEVARKRGVPGRPLDDYLRVLPQYEEQLRKIFAEMESDRVNASERDTEDVPAPRDLQQWKSGNWVDCYRLVEILGRGTYGEVWKAEGIDGGLVAIKAMNVVNADKQPHPTASLEARAESLAGEARVLRKLTGKNLRVPKYVGKGEHHGRRYLVMECIEGRDLRSARMQPGNWHWRRCTEIVLSLLETVERLTSLSYYHYDIKPHNVILDPEDRAWVIDLGSAQSWEQMCARFLDPYPATSKGYAPPELLLGWDTQFTAQTGIYLVGGVLYYLLTGKHPKPENEKAWEQFEAHKLTPQAPGELHPGLPEWLDALCLRMLAHNREDRPLNATAVIEEIRRELSAPPPTPAPLLDTGVARKAPPATSTWRRIAGLTALVVAVGGTTLGALSILGPRNQVPLRMLSPEDMAFVSIGENKHHRIPEGPVVVKDGVQFKNSWPTLMSVFEAAVQDGKFTTTIPLDVTGKVNSIGLAHNRQQEKLDDLSLPVYTFSMLTLSPALTPEDDLEWEFSYDKFYSTNPDVPEPGEGQVAEGQIRSVAPEKIHLKTFKVRRRPESPHFLLRLSFEDNYLMSVDVNGTNIAFPAASPISPRVTGFVYLLIDSLITSDTQPEDWGKVWLGKPHTVLGP